MKSTAPAFIALTTREISAALNAGVMGGGWSAALGPGGGRQPGQEPAGTDNYGFG